jgi:transposase
VDHGAAGAAGGFRAPAPPDRPDRRGIWGRTGPLLPEPAAPGRKPGAVDLREVPNAIRYPARAGRGWRTLPHGFPPWRTVCRWFRRFARRLSSRTIRGTALMLGRERAGRGASPGAGVLDGRTAKAPAAPEGGKHGAAERLKGRKRRIAVDTGGRLPMVDPTTADVRDAAGAGRITAAIRKRRPSGSSTSSPTGRAPGASRWAGPPTAAPSSRSCASSSVSEVSGPCPAAGWPPSGRSAGRRVGATARARPRAAPRRPRGDDPRRHGRRAAPASCSPRASSNGHLEK